jgi:hypothetical protein
VTKEDIAILLALVGIVVSVLLAFLAFLGSVVVTMLA